MEYIAELDDDGIPPKQIPDRIQKAFQRSISLRTVNRVLDWHRQRRRDPEPWTIAQDVRGIDPALALPALAGLIERTGGRRVQLTIGEARWITRVRRAVPEIPVGLALRVAQMYPRTTPGRVLDAYLAFEPWRGNEQRNAYLRAIENGWLPAWAPATLRALLGEEVEIG